MKQLLILPKGSGLTAKEKERLTRAGFLTLELENPGQARLVSPAGSELGASQLALCAIRAMAEAKYSSTDSVRSTFVLLLSEAMKAESGHNG